MNVSLLIITLITTSIISSLTIELHFCLNNHLSPSSSIILNKIVDPLDFDFKPFY